jgi:hypothetical protein
MISRLFRAALFGACVLAMWLVALPAFAADGGGEENEGDARAARAAASAAPLCDDRGATLLAPAPIVQLPSASLEQLEHDASCALGMNDEAATSPSDENAPKEASPMTSDALAAFTSSRTRIAPPDSTLALANCEHVVVSAGVHNRVERPPRHG